MRAYRDDRDAALSLAASLQRENDLLRAENEHLRELVDPGVSRWRGAMAQASSALAVTLMLLGAMVGAGLIVQQTAAAAEANVTTSADLGARLAVVSPHEVAPPAPADPAPVAAATPGITLPDPVIVATRHRHHHRRHAHHRHHHRDRG